MKKIFIVAPHFPPSALPPSQRVRLLVKHFHSLGFYPVIFTVDHKYREELEDPLMVKLAGDKFEVIHIKCLHQKNTRRLGIGDLGLRMIPFLPYAMIKAAKKYKPAFMLYPVPPWYIMIITPLVKWFTKVPYGIDFIDPWVTNENKTDTKAKLSQWVARNLEGFSLKRCSAIFAVSQGILNDLIKRYPFVKAKQIAAVPYGVEVEDYKLLINKKLNNPEDKLLLRYIGAISDSMLIVVEGMLSAIKLASNQKKIAVEFIGTSYAGGGFATPRVNDLIEKVGVSNFISESPARVAYAEALTLTVEADVLLLIGDMTSYYSASKLMGLIASQKPFFAFLHKGSFPAIFLNQCNYQHVVLYTDGNDGPLRKVNEVVNALHQLVQNLNGFKPISLDEPLFLQNSAYQMTKTFADNIKQAIHD